MLLAVEHWAVWHVKWPKSSCNLSQASRVRSCRGSSECNEKMSIFLKYSWKVSHAHAVASLGTFLLSPPLFHVILISFPHLSMVHITLHYRNVSSGKSPWEINVWPKALGTNASVSIRHTQKNLGPGCNKDGAWVRPWVWQVIVKSARLQGLKWSADEQRTEGAMWAGGQKLWEMVKEMGMDMDSLPRHWVLVALLDMRGQEGRSEQRRLEHPRDSTKIWLFPSYDRLKEKTKGMTAGYFLQSNIIQMLSLTYCGIVALIASYFWEGR